VSRIIWPRFGEQHADLDEGDQEAHVEAIDGGRNEVATDE